MVDVAAAAEALIQAYNAKDFDVMERMIAPNLDFAHFNRAFVMTSRDALLAVLRDFAGSYVPDRHFEAPERVTVAGDMWCVKPGISGRPAWTYPALAQRGKPSA